ncbi:MAG TPA: tRNA uridine-5-carboxymethylaminomethyl(34) synthesis enzyme MnmG [Verrucomicrobiae bacterium]|nr:tRNA uridine-5-carboxymethylaminomethyl(34) synthesis enzyme MnmG [Verrucomicrobiae bacterium]
MFVYPKKYDVIVVGAGHAGIEAALAAARLGRQVLLLTMNADTIGQMSCNPAIGGQAKGQLVREIDALGGEMGLATDMSGIQFRMLNTKKGPAVWSPRAQCDKKAYQFRMKWVCERQSNLDVKQGHTTEVLFNSDGVTGVQTSLGVQFLAKVVVITTGTFLKGLMHIGNGQETGGRAGEPASTGISGSLRKMGLELGRLKTGTPPRLLRRSIDFSKMESQPGDYPVPYFSYWHGRPFHVEQSFLPNSVLAQHGEQLNCFITRTTEKTASLIRENIHLSPLYAGIIEGVGPRYCPSIEDKIMRFADKESHQIFLEPEGVATDEFYVNGLSTCLPFGVQIDLIRSVIGCESAEILRPAYAVEYDFVHPTQLKQTLEVKVCRNLFLAGQINGTSGYEEAAAQGLMAGINAARSVAGLSPFVLGRDQAYIGVLVDDLVTKGTVEPYRMFTSRAEHRLVLRQDNADLRLSELGHQICLLPQSKYERFCEKRSKLNQELARLKKTRVGNETLAQQLKRPEMTYAKLPDRDNSLPTDVIQQVEIGIKYAGYIARQSTEINRIKNLEEKGIPEDLDFSVVPSLRLEAKQKLAQIKPRTIGQASRISGVSPADISILAVWLKRYKSQSPVQATEPFSDCSCD